MTDSPLFSQLKRPIGRAMHDYDMLADGDRVMVAVSGGVDSLVLCWVLDHWRSKAPIDYELLGVHLDMGFSEPTAPLVAGQLEQLKFPFLIEKTDFGQRALEAQGSKGGCFHCAKKRRNRLFELAAEHRITKIAFGHHQEDIIETLFLNMLYSGNLSAMVPRQDLFAGKLAIIRPLAYLEKKEIRGLAEELGITPVKNPCPMQHDSQREQVRNLLTPLFAQDARIKANIFAALGNVKPDYLLKPRTAKKRHAHQS